MIQFRTRIRTDLNANPTVYTLGRKLFTQDNKANRIDVDVFNNGEKVTVEGSIVGIVKRNDGNAIAFTGDIDEGVPYVELPEAAYAVEGPISILIRNIEGDTRTVIGVCDAYVTKSADAEYVTAGTEVVSIEDLEEKLSEIEPLLERLSVIDLSDTALIQEMLTDLANRETTLNEEIESFESLVTVDEENETIIFKSFGELE